MDWAAFEDELVAGVVAKVTERAGQASGLYAAVLGEIYAETDGLIRLPMLGANSEEELAGDEDLRWSLPDWDTVWESWLPEDRWSQWERALTDEAGRSTTRHWERTFTKYLNVLTRVCKRARKDLRTTGVTDREFVVVVLTNDQDEERLLRRVLGVRELYRLFPAYDRAAAWIAEVEAQAPADRAPIYVRALDDWDGPLGRENAQKALRELGPAALPALTELLSQGPDRWRAAKLIADIGCASDEVIEALTRALKDTTGPDESWVAVALSRLGRLDVVLADSALSGGTVVSAVAAPYRSFRDHAAAPPPLDYGPLERFLTGHPRQNDAVAEELRPGSGYCTIRAEEVGAAIDALRSPHPVTRRHAASVLGERSLGKAVGRQVTPHLSTTAVDDPDATVRRLAILSLQYWKQDARHCADAGRRALHDPEPDVRAAAQRWLDSLST
ncbi:DUF4303 domain-containing protein [Actinomadura barringtoniae]|uniref:DUF4303 domain-containing protein n=1 Tax=Actinomadura barringtoniae TaxID=1427535 RepID=A0A939PAT0_9ACTN|nr:DUF4303 domain-containing protein [Actinomadura barringtoniae]MBO2449160.1 DUF4303 domain-containing protein [Actinomadura barringtoniae]